MVKKLTVELKIYQWQSFKRLNMNKTWYKTNKTLLMKRLKYVD